MEGGIRVTTAPQQNNDLRHVIIMTQIMTKTNKMTDLIMIHFTKNNDLPLGEPCSLVIGIISIQFKGQNAVVL